MPDTPTIGGGPSETGSEAASSRGVTVTAGGSPNTKGSWTECIPSTDYRGDWMMLTAQYNNAAARYLFDVGVGASTAEVVLIPNLYFEVKSANSAPGVTYTMPIRIPAASRVSVRSQASSGGAVLVVCPIVISAPIDAPPGLSLCEAAGVVSSAATRLTQIDPGANAHTDSAWTQLIASTAFNYQWVCVAFGHSVGAMGAAASWLFDIGIGGAGSEQVLVSDIYVYGGSVVDAPLPMAVSFPLKVPVGSRLSARVRSSATADTDRDVDVALWGFG